MLIGHGRLVEDFKRLTEKDLLAHGYLFYGAPNVGKKTFALHLANFLERGEFGESGLLSDVDLVVPDEEGTIGIDAMRGVRRFLSQKPVISKRRTVIIDETERMTREAENALLKIAEEPPESSLLILIALDRESLATTLCSRLQNIYFSPVPVNEISKWLKNEALAAVSFGRPGLAWRMANDEAFQSLLKSARALLASGFWERRNMVKALLEKDDFDFGALLDAMVFVIAGSVRTERSPKIFAQWHRVLELRKQEASFNLNPRLQLEALLNYD